MEGHEIHAVQPSTATLGALSLSPTRRSVRNSKKPVLFGSTEAEAGPSTQRAWNGSSPPSVATSCSSPLSPLTSLPSSPVTSRHSIRNTEGHDKLTPFDKVQARLRKAPYDTVQARLNAETSDTSPIPKLNGKGKDKRTLVEIEHASRSPSPMPPPRKTSATAKPKARANASKGAKAAEKGAINLTAGKRASKRAASSLDINGYNRHLQTDSDGHLNGTVAQARPTDVKSIIDEETYDDAYEDRYTTSMPAFLRSAANVSDTDSSDDERKVPPSSSQTNGRKASPKPARNRGSGTLSNSPPKRAATRVASSSQTMVSDVERPNRSARRGMRPVPTTSTVEDDSEDSSLSTAEDTDDDFVFTPKARKAKKKATEGKIRKPAAKKSPAKKGSKALDNVDEMTAEDAELARMRQEAVATVQWKPPPNSSSPDRGKRRKAAKPDKGAEEGKKFFATYSNRRLAAAKAKDMEVRQAVDGADEVLQAEAPQEPIAVSPEVMGPDEEYCLSYLHPTKKCPYCREKLPKKPSPDLVALEKKLQDLCRQRRTALPPSVQIGTFCHKHRGETSTVPLGERAGYPMSIDFADLDDRLETGLASVRIREVLGKPQESGFFNYIVDRIDPAHPKAYKDAAQLMSTDAVERAAPGYYGDLGRDIIVAHFTDMLRWKHMSLHDPAPLSKDDFILLVVVPEAAVSLIMEDAGWSGSSGDEGWQEAYDRASVICRESMQYGQIKFEGRDSLSGKKVMTLIEARRTAKKERLQPQEFQMQEEESWMRVQDEGQDQARPTIPEAAQDDVKSATTDLANGSSASQAIPLDIFSSAPQAPSSPPPPAAFNLRRSPRRRSTASAAQSTPSPRKSPKRVAQSTPSPQKSPKRAAISCPESVPTPPSPLSPLTSLPPPTPNAPVVRDSMPSSPIPNFVPSSPRRWPGQSELPRSNEASPTPVTSPVAGAASTEVSAYFDSHPLIDVDLRASQEAKFGVAESPSSVFSPLPSAPQHSSQADHGRTNGSGWGRESGGFGLVSQSAAFTQSAWTSSSGPPIRPTTPSWPSRQVMPPADRWSMPPQPHRSHSPYEPAPPSQYRYSEAAPYPPSQSQPQQPWYRGENNRSPNSHPKYLQFSQAPSSPHFPNHTRF